MEEKHIIVDSNIHKKAKIQAAMRGMTIRDYIEKLLDADKADMNKRLKG